MKKLAPLAAVVAAGVAAVVAAVVLATGEGRDAGAPAAPTPAEGARAEPARLASVEAPHERREEAQTVEETTEPAAVADDAEAVAPSQPEREPAPQPEDGILVRVLLGESDEPVGRARVFHVGEGDIALQDMAAVRRMEGILGFAREHGRLFVADEAGRLRVPRREAWIAAESNGRRGEGLIDPDDSGAVELRLRPLVEITARVVDPSGAPVAGVPVVFQVLDTAFSRAVTDDEGLATLRVSPSFFSAIASRSRAPDLETALAVDATLAEPAQEAVDLENPPQEPVVLVLPATGEVEVVFGDDGPARGGRMAGLVLVEPTEELEAQAMMRAFSEMQPVEGERILFPRVEVGTDVVAVVGTVGQVEPARVRAAGPERPGERVVVHVLSGAPPVLGMRVVGPDGEPLGETVISIEMDTAHGGTSLSGLPQRTDAEGRLRVPVSEALMADEGVLVLEARAAAAPADEPLTARREVPLPLPAAGTELGDLVLRTPPVLAAGTVVDGNGDPVPGARVFLVRGYRSTEGAEVSWIGAALAETRTRADGSFELRGWPESLGLPAFPDEMRRPEPSYAVRAQSPRYVASRRQPIPLGARGVVLRLRGAGSIEGRLELDEEIPAQHLSLRLLRQSDGAPVQETRTQVGADGTFVVRSVPPGRYALEIGSGGAMAARAADGVQVREGEETDLGAIDLTEALRRISVEVETADGRMPRSITFLHRPSDGASDGWERTRILGNRYHEITAARGLDFVVQADGYRAERLDHVTGKRSVMLVPGTPVHARLETVPELPEGVELKLVLRPEREGRGYRMLRVEERVGLDGTASLRAPAIGPHRAEVHAVLLEESWTRTSQLGEGEAIDVPDSARGTSITVPLDTGELDKWLQGLDLR